MNIIYAGNEDVPDSLAFKDDFFNGSGPVDLKVNIIKKSGTDTIISQYIGFCKVFNEQREKYGKTVEAVEETIRICTELGFLRDYLIKHSEEVITMMDELFDEEYLRKQHDTAVRAEGRKEGIKEKENKYLLSLLNHVNSGKIPLSDAASIANMTVDEFKRASEALISP